MKKFYKRLFYIFITVFLLGAIVHALIIFLIDPLMNYRIPTFYQPYISNERYMNPGMAKNLKYDSILVGSSVTQIMKPSDFDSVFGGKTVKLSMNDITAYETSQILQVGLNSNKVRRVYYGIDPFSFRGKVDRVAYKELPLYIYNDNLFDDYKYLLNTQVLIKDIGLKLIFAKIIGHKPNHSNSIDNPYYVDVEYSGKRLYNNWKNQVSKVEDISNIYKCRDMKKSFNINIGNLIKSNKDTDFYLFFPPYSILYWDRVLKEGWIDDAICFKKYVAEFSLKYENLHLFDYQQSTDISFNLDNYENLRHYSPGIGKKIITMIKSNEGAIDRYSENSYNFSIIKNQAVNLNDSQLLFSK